MAMLEAMIKTQSRRGEEKRRDETRREWVGGLWQAEWEYGV